MYKSILSRLLILTLSLILTAASLSSCSLFKTDAEITGITVNGEKLKSFDKNKLTYTVELSAGNETPPQVAAIYHEAGYINPPVVVQAQTADGIATVTSGSLTYSIIFIVKEYDESYLHNTFRKLAVDKKLNITVLGGSSSCADAGIDTWQKELVALISDTFKSAKITLTDLSEPNTRSESFKNIELAAKPNLLFIDTTLGDQAAELLPIDAAAELRSLILEINDKYPQCEIIAIISTNAEYATSGYPVSSAVTAMLDELGAKYIDLADAFPRGIEDMSAYFSDSGLPTHAAHELFAYSIFTFVHHETVELMPNPSTLRDVVFSR